MPSLIPRSPKTQSPIPISSPPSPRTMTLSVSSVTNIFVKMRSYKDRHHITSTSGDPQTHASLSGEGTTSIEKVPIEHTDVFICTGAVDVDKLLRGTRMSLLGKAISLGANVLVDEQWTCTICGPKQRPICTFKVHIHYSASAARAQRPDPNKPVGLDCAKGVAGLMTITERSECLQ